MNRGVSRRALCLGGLVAAACGPSPGAASDPRQPRPDLYDCEGCEAAREFDPARLDWRATLASPEERGERLRIEGVVYDADARAPVDGVVIYAWHTDAEGLYSRGGGQTGWGRLHGLLRGAVRTRADGLYRFDTIKPAPYPDLSMPAHVHLVVLEPARRPYWIDDVVFAGEHGVDDAYRRNARNRGGDGIVELRRDDGLWRARRDIVLERHP